MTVKKQKQENGTSRIGRLGGRSAITGLFTSRSSSIACAGCGVPLVEWKTAEGWRITDAAWCPACGWLA